MKISLSEIYDKCLCDLQFGDVFELYGTFYMLVNTGGRMFEVANSMKFCCVSLTDGECDLIDCMEKVQPLDATLHLEEYNNVNRKSNNEKETGEASGC